MAVVLSQPRAMATRRAILRAAVDLFGSRGFAGTSLDQIVRRAEVTQGGFYYHFKSKEEVAFAVIDDVAQRMNELRGEFLNKPAPGLADVIEMTFALSSRLSQDPAYLVAAYLEHTIARYSPDGVQGVAARVEGFVAGTAAALGGCRLREGVDPEEAAKTLVAVVYGCLAMRGLVADDIRVRLAQCWRMLLPGLLEPGLVAEFDGVVDALAGGHPR